MTTTFEGIHFNLDSAPDKFTYCQFESNPFDDPESDAPTGRQYYRTAFTIHTVDGMPDWQPPDQSG